jgi:hypothetical protein
MDFGGIVVVADEGGAVVASTDMFVKVGKNSRQGHGDVGWAVKGIMTRNPGTWHLDIQWPSSRQFSKL